MNRKFKIKTKLILILVFCWSIGLILSLVSAKSLPEVKHGQIIIDEPLSNGSFFIATGKLNQNNESQIIRSDFPFNSLYLKWTLKDDSLAQVTTLPFELEVRFLNETWSDWKKIGLDDDYNGKDQEGNEMSSQLISCKLTDSFQYKLQFASDEMRENLKSLDFIYLDTTKGPKGNFKIATSNNDLRIISREEWGANETYQYDDQGNNTWEEEYYTPMKFVIHHTAGENSNTDPKAAVRAIQYWHAIGRGWGDIGYNYLIDSQGNIYEGRRGGDGVVGGHAYLRNRNTIGIAILGCYDSSCSKPDQLTTAAKISLNKLIAAKSREFNIDPLAETDFHGETLANVIGHRDVGQTTCPGNLIYDDLPQTRELAYNLLQELGGYNKPLPTSAQLVKLSAQEINIEETKTNQIVVEFKNTGQAIWRGYEDAGIYIADSQIKNKLAKIGSVNIASTSSQTKNNLIQFKLIDGNVYPGEIGKFVLTFKAPQTKKETVKFTLAWQNKGYFPDTDFAITLNRVPCTSCQSNSGNQTNSAELIANNWPAKIASGAKKHLIITVKNTGAKTWKQGNLKLKIIAENNNQSAFNYNWPDDYGLFSPQQDQILPGATANFEFDIKAPQGLGTYLQQISLLDQNLTINQWDQTSTVISPYSADITSHNIPVAVKKSWRPTVKITFTNSGTKTWVKPTLKSYDIDYTNSWFKDRSWQDNKTVKALKKNVAPGESITFEFKLTPYWKANTYPQLFKLFDGTQEISLNNKKDFVLYTRVDN